MKLHVYKYQILDSVFNGYCFDFAKLDDTKWHEIRVRPYIDSLEIAERIAEQHFRQMEIVSPEQFYAHIALQSPHGKIETISIRAKTIIKFEADNAKFPISIRRA